MVAEVTAEPEGSVESPVTVASGVWAKAIGIRRIANRARRCIGSNSMISRKGISDCLGERRKRWRLDQVSRHPKSDIRNPLLSPLHDGRGSVGDPLPVVA